jgi:hypothetical protein
MFILVGKSINPDGHTFYKWIVGYSPLKRDLIIRYKKIKERLANFSPFFRIENSTLFKARLSHNDTIKIKGILNGEKLDEECDFISSFGINYDIIRIEELKEVT